MKCCCKSNPTQYERNRWFVYLVLAVAWTANAAKLPNVGLWLNASKSESMLAATIFTLTGVFVPIAFWSTRYFTTLPNVGRVKSSVDDLIMERGTVSMGVAFVLRPAEVQPLFWDLCSVPSFALHWSIAGCVANSLPPHWNDSCIRSKMRTLKCRDHTPWKCSNHALVSHSFRFLVSGFFSKPTTLKVHYNQPFLEKP